MLLLLSLLLPLARAQQQPEEHLALLPGFSVWQEHIVALQQAEQRLRQEGGGVQPSSRHPKPQTQQEAEVHHQGQQLFPKSDYKEEMKDVIKKIVKNNLKELKADTEGPVEKSPIELLLEKSQVVEGGPVKSGSESFLDQLTALFSSNEEHFVEPKRPESVPGTFLDQLTSVLSFNEDIDQNIVDTELVHPELTSTDAFLDTFSRLFDNDAKDEIHIEDRSSLGSTASRILGVLELADIEEESRIVEGSKGGGRQREFDDSESVILNAIVDENQFRKTFLEEEIASSELESVETANQLALLLADLEADRQAEATLVEKVMADINSGLRSGRHSRGFIDSVLYRFALMALPLRQEDIAVSEGHEIRKVVRASLGLLAGDLGALEGGEERGGGLQEARRKLQALLNIMET